MNNAGMIESRYKGILHGAPSNVHRVDKDQGTYIQKQTSQSSFPNPLVQTGYVVAPTCTANVTENAAYTENTPRKCTPYTKNETRLTYGQYADQLTRQCVPIMSLYKGINTCAPAPIPPVPIPPVLGLPLTFDSPTLTYSFFDFAGAVTTVVNNPYPGNPSSRVARSIKYAGAQTYAGSSITMGYPIDFSTMQTIKMRVGSPTAGIIVKLKLEKLNAPSISVEVDATVTLINTWQELTFNFAGIINANQYQIITVFFDFGNFGNNASYYFDDIRQV